MMTFLRKGLCSLFMFAVTLLPMFTVEGFAESHLYIGYSFFKPSADRMPFHAASYSSFWHDGHDTDWHGLIDYLRGVYPGVDIRCLPYGQATTDLRLLFADSNLPDVNFLVGAANDALFIDTLGHAGQITTRDEWAGVGTHDLRGGPEHL